MFTNLDKCWSQAIQIGEGPLYSLMVLKPNSSTQSSYNIYGWDLDYKALAAYMELLNKVTGYIVPNSGSGVS